MPNFIDLTGHIYGRLTVISLASLVGERNKKWLCRCSCGTELTIQSGNLRCGTSQSCGCLRKKLARLRAMKHGMAQSETYMIWKGMRKRCGNINDQNWPKYGGRGIRVCERWADFGVFLADMGERPPGMSIERVNNERGYEPGNCIWAGIDTQSRNKRNTRTVTICGKRLPIIDACRIYGVPRNSVWTYRSQKNLTLTEAFFDLLDRRWIHSP